MMLAIILQSIGIPLEGIALILGVERILDMCRTSINVWGDACCATIVARLSGERTHVAIDNGEPEEEAA